MVKRVVGIEDVPGDWQDALAPLFASDALDILNKNLCVEAKT